MVQFDYYLKLTSMRNLTQKLCDGFSNSWCKILYNCWVWVVLYVMSDRSMKWMLPYKYNAKPYVINILYTITIAHCIHSYRPQCSSVVLHIHQSFDSGAQPPKQEVITHDQSAAAISSHTTQGAAAVLTYREMIKGSSTNTFPPSIFGGGWRGHRTKGKETYPAHFHQLGDHDNTEAVLLPNHPPEVVDHLLLGACRGGDVQWRYRWGKGEREKGRPEGGGGEREGG